MRKGLLLIVTIIFLTLGVLAVLVYQASPAPDSQTILGIGISDPGPDNRWVYLPGRRLACGPAEEAPYTSPCTVDIAGDPLAISATRVDPDQPNLMLGLCEATYRGQSWPCSMGSRHVHVHYFAYVEEPLGLTSAEIDTLRSQYVIENLPESPFMASLLAVPTLIALMVVLLVVALRWPNLRWQAAIVALVALAGLPLVTYWRGIQGQLIFIGMLIVGIVGAKAWAWLKKQPAAADFSLLTGLGLVSYIGAFVFTFWLTNYFWD